MKRVNNMATKYLEAAILCTGLTVAYYAKMIPAWIQLDESNVKSSSVRDEAKTKSGILWEDVEESRQDAVNKGDSHKSEFDIVELAEISPQGDPPPNYAFWIKEPKYRCDSILKINTSKDASYVVKIVDPYNGEVIMTFYLPAGISQEIDVPSGTFEIRYTSGTEWFGDDKMFGDKGTYAKADQTFRFSDGSGYELTLYRVRNGNLHTSKIRKEDF